jgi:hypothetical protein
VGLKKSAGFGEMEEFWQSVITLAVEDLFVVAASKSQSPMAVPD